MGLSRQKYWSGLPCPPPGDLPDPGIEPRSPASPVLQVDSLPTEPPGKPPILWYVSLIQSFYDRIIFHCMDIPHSQVSKIWFYLGVLIDIYLLINEIVYHFYLK